MIVSRSKGNWVTRNLLSLQIGSCVYSNVLIFYYGNLTKLEARPHRTPFTRTRSHRPKEPVAPGHGTQPMFGSGSLAQVGRRRLEVRFLGRSGRQRPENGHALPLKAPLLTAASA